MYCRVYVDLYRLCTMQTISKIHYAGLTSLAGSLKNHSPVEVTSSNESYLIACATRASLASRNSSCRVRGLNKFLE